MYVLDLSCLFTFGMSTKFNRNILSFIIKVFVPASFLFPTSPLLTINKRKISKCGRVQSMSLLLKKKDEKGGEGK